MKIPSSLLSLGALLDHDLSQCTNNAIIPSSLMSLRILARGSVMKTRLPRAAMRVDAPPMARTAIIHLVGCHLAENLDRLASNMNGIDRRLRASSDNQRLTSQKILLLCVTHKCLHGSYAQQ
jgi:hypothetical protein